MPEPASFPPRQGLLLLGHGSRHPGLGRPFEAFKQGLQAELGPGHWVEDAYLSLCPPTLSQALDGFLAQGIHQVTLLPLFLIAGHHLSQELPELVRAEAQARPQLSLLVAPHLGALPGLTQLMKEQWESALKQAAAGSIEI